MVLWVFDGGDCESAVKLSLRGTIVLLPLAEATSKVSVIWTRRMDFYVEKEHFRGILVICNTFNCVELVVFQQIARRGI